MDKATGKAFLDADGKEIKAETTFTPTQPTGTVTVEFVFNATGLHGKEVVAFETLYYEGIELATHAEINDEGQTVEREESADQHRGCHGRWQQDHPYRR